MARTKVDIASREEDDARGDEGGRKGQPPWLKGGRKKKSERKKGRKK